MLALYGPELPNPGTFAHLPGLIDERSSYRYQGLGLRLTGVEKARVVGQIFA